MDVPIKIYILWKKFIDRQKPEMDVSALTGGCKIELLQVSLKFCKMILSKAYVDNLG